MADPKIPVPEHVAGAGLLARLDAFDQALSARCLVAPGTGARRVVMGGVRRISQTGSYGVGWVVLFAVVATWLEGPLVALVAAGCVVGTLFVNTSVKELVRRTRPVAGSFSHQPASYSMPSAHTAMAVVGAGVMSVIAPELAPVWWAWAVILAVSRVVLGMHFVGDVVLGALFGTLLAWSVAAPLIHSLV
ncbi:MAG: phosphatase PAP2 family protein [Thermoleophilia bacterium]|nr:phosphatase PAP2 family protein [Thermoleophilia bacterium]